MADPQEADVQYMRPVALVAWTTFFGFCQRGAKSRAAYFKMTQAIISSPHIKARCPGAQCFRRRQITGFELVRLLLHESEGILGESAGGRQQQTGVLWGLSQETLDQFQTERRRVFDDIRIVVAGKIRACL